MEAGKDCPQTGFITGRSVEKAEYEAGSCCCARWSKKKICGVTYLGCVVVTLIVIGSLVGSFLLKPTLEGNAEEWEGKLFQGRNLNSNINIDGSYTLKAFDENYEPYLRSLGIPGFVVPIILRASERITVIATDKGATMITETGWKTQEFSYEWNRVWNMTYGRNDGIMWNNCTRESPNVIFCSSEERDKQWFLTSRMTFSDLGMVNERHFLNENISAKKFYEKEAEDAINDEVEEVDLFDDEDDEEFGSDGEWEWK